MTELIRSWVIGITAMSLITSVVMAITPSGKVRKTISLICGMAMIVVLISPVLDFDYDSLSQYVKEYDYSTEELENNLDKENERLAKAIIEEKSSAYILDKAESVGGQDAHVSVEAKLDNEGSWNPWEVTIGGDYTSEQQSEIKSTIEEDLGIPVERQYWSTDDE